MAEIGATLSSEPVPAKDRNPAGSSHCGAVPGLDASRPSLPRDLRSNFRWRGAGIFASSP